MARFLHRLGSCRRGSDGAPLAGSSRLDVKPERLSYACARAGVRACALRRAGGAIPPFSVAGPLRVATICRLRGINPGVCAG